MPRSPETNLIADLTKLVDRYPGPSFDYPDGIGYKLLPCDDIMGDFNPRTLSYRTYPLPVPYEVIMRGNSLKAGVGLTARFAFTPLKVKAPPLPSVSEIAYGLISPKEQPSYRCQGVPINPCSDWALEIAEGMRKHLPDPSLLALTVRRDTGRNIKCLNVRLACSEGTINSGIDFFTNRTTQRLADPVHTIILQSNLPLDVQVSAFVSTSRALLSSLPGSEVVLNSAAENVILEKFQTVHQNHAVWSNRQVA